jgi:hypothetical protein
MNSNDIMWIQGLINGPYEPGIFLKFRNEPNFPIGNLSYQYYQTFCLRLYYE